MWPVAFPQIAFTVAAIKIRSFFFHNLHWFDWIVCLTGFCVYLWFCHNSTEFFKKNVQNTTLYKLICWVVWASVHQTSMVLTNNILTTGRWASKGRECPFLAKMLQGRWKVKTWKMLTSPQSPFVSTIYARPSCFPFLPIRHIVLSFFRYLSEQSITITLTSH